MSDASSIINDAAGRVEVKGVQRRARDPFRTIRLVELKVPRCERYPEGKVIYVHPRQVIAHQKLFPGSFVLRELVHKPAKPIVESGMVPMGHRSVADFLPDGMTVETKAKATGVDPEF